MAKKNQNKEIETAVSSEKTVGSFFNTFIITIITGVCFLILTTLPIYNQWLKGQIKGYYKEYKIQKKTPNMQTRWEQRHGYDFVIPAYLATQLDSSKHTLLLPPTEYLKKNNVGYNWTDARWLYYMTEKKIRKVYLTDSNARTATHTIVASPQGLNILEITNDSIFNQTIALFK